MPTYLLHGFRWHRQAIRIHIVVNDLEDAAPEWIVAPATSLSLLNSFYANFDFLPPSNPPPQKYEIPIPPTPAEEEDPKPKTLKKGHKASIGSLRSLGRKNRPPNLGSLKKENGTRGTDSLRTQGPSNSTSKSSLPTQKDKPAPNFNEWSVVKLVEQYDPESQVVSQPYAYVADYIVDITLSASLKEESAKYEEKVREADWPLSSPGSPEVGAEGGHHRANSSVDIGSTGISARELRRKGKRLGWLEKLRDGLQKGEDIGWYVVYCGDEVRASPSMEELDRISSGDEDELSPQRTPRSATLKSFFRGRSNTVEE